MGKVLKMSDWRPPSENREVERRLRDNADLIRRMKAGESLARIPQSATFFQPRAIVEKDKKAITAIFTNKDKK